MICFGEVLWDLLPAGRFLGGAPLNFAYHLMKLGGKPLVMSAVGEDPLGDEALAQISTLGLDTAGIRRHAHFPTGTAAAALGENGAATYGFSTPAAWDEIEPPEIPQAAQGLYFGSLALRAAANRTALRRLLNGVPSFRVCDLNLRGQADLAFMDEYIRGVELLKVNAEEASRLVPINLAHGPVAAQAEYLAAHFGCETVCVTLGAGGAVLWHDRRVYSASAPKVQVRDTVGAGDAFAACLVAGMLDTKANPEWSGLLARAANLGAFVATQDGAQPNYAGIGITLASPPEK